MSPKALTWIGLAIAALTGADHYVLDHHAFFPPLVDGVAGMAGAVLAALGPALRASTSSAS